MSAITLTMTSAIQEEKERKSGNDRVVCSDILRREYTWFYHNNPIVKADLGVVILNPCDHEGNPSTRERLNAAIWRLTHFTAMLSIRAGVLMLNGEPAGEPPYIFRRKL
jgi:hypothetical protein